VLVLESLCDTGMRLYTSRYLSDLPPRTMVRLVCNRCQRKGQYRRETLLEKHGDGPLPGLLSKVAADCPRLHAITGARCGVVYGES
jgi:hypothetical protein